MSVIPRRIGHQLPAAEPRTGPDRNTVLLGVIGEVGDDQEIAGEPHVDDDSS